MSPVFDYVCHDCGTMFERFVWDRDHVVCCPDCDQPTEKVWTSAPALVPDTVPGGFVIENLDKHPRRFFSRSEFKDELRARGLTSPLVDGIGSSRFRHLGSPDGSDKGHTTTDPHTGRRVTRSSRWI